MRKQRIHIIAPHADDELIGCYRVLHSYPVSTIFYPAKEPLTEAASFLTDKGIRARFIEVFDLHVQPGDLVFAPDLVYEIHPLHKELGALATRKAKYLGLKVIYYSTNMNAPYIEDLGEKVSANKKHWLNKYYPMKSELWKYDWKYFLFEGYRVAGFQNVMQLWQG